tara:strand:- start:56 stop:238 length:183 start_codon:yes stop_codon:yes gene_type:complete
MRRYKIMVYRNDKPNPVMSLIESRSIAIAYAQKELEKNDFVVVTDDRDNIVFQERKNEKR